MRVRIKAITWVSVLAVAAYACAEEGQDGEVGNNNAKLGERAQAPAGRPEGVAPAVPGRPEAAPAGPGEGTPDAGQPPAPPELDCADGAVGEIRVAFDCDAITVVSCRELSNVVVEYADGTQQRFEGLSGHAGSFVGTGANAGKRITRVWIKAGANLSGDGPGFGTSFLPDPDQRCDSPRTPPPPPPPSTSTPVL